MALSSWSRELGLGSQKALPVAAVSTGPSLELCTFPSTLGSSVATDALEQLLVVEQSLQSDYFKCNEEAKNFLKDVAIAVKKLEEMRKSTIDLLEIESMELSRLYFVLETLPTSVSRELEGTLTLLEIYHSFCQEGFFFSSERQEELVKLYGKIVLSLNQAMKERASITIYINETYTKINSEKKELELQKTYIREIEEQIERERAEYLKKKEKLNQESFHDLLNFQQVLSDHNLEIARLQESIREWEQKVEDMKKSSLREKLQTVSRQYKIVLNEEDKVFMQKRKIYSENKKQLAFIAQKENFLSKRKVDIKNMEEGLITLGELHRYSASSIAQIILYDFFCFEFFIFSTNCDVNLTIILFVLISSIITQWKIACLQKKHARWVKNIRNEIQELIDKIQEAESRRSELMEEVKEPKELVFAPYIDCISVILQYFITLYLIADLFELYKVIVDFMFEQKKVKQELKQLREHESYKTKAHFEILKSLENEIYFYDLKTDALILENKRLKEVSSRALYFVRWSWLISISVLELTESGNETLREIKNLIDKLGERDEKIEQISTWLQSDLEEIRSLMEQESET
ncbi:hypothetical protein MJG53_020729, partial [Ovis ammon polii x Ovis aries]